MMEIEMKKLVAIAKKNYLIAEGREDLKAANTDWQDFTNCAVWSIEAALIEAYELGKAAANNKK